MLVLYCLSRKANEGSPATIAGTHSGITALVVYAIPCDSVNGTELLHFRQQNFKSSEMLHSVIPQQISI